MQRQKKEINMPRKGVVMEKISIVIMCLIGLTVSYTYAKNMSAFKIGREWDLDFVETSLWLSCRM